jgi:two-component system, NtrC family, sensor histidine kinase HydH
MNDRPQPSFPFSLPEDASGRDRLAEIGQIASGLVHELKNPLGVILLNTQMLLESHDGKSTPAEHERARKRLERIRDSSRSLQDIIQSFLTFARPPRPDRDAVDVNGLLRQVLDDLGEQLEKSHIKVSFHPDDDLALLPADQQQLRSIFTNVIGNARDALHDRASDRKLLIVTRSGHQMVRVVIANNGPPLPENIAAHLFEPFYSSKESGTGLGLAIVRRLVELHNGTVEVSSDPSQGVSFTFEFPSTLGPAALRTQLPMPEVEATVRPGTDRVEKKKKARK